MPLQKLIKLARLSKDWQMTVSRHEEVLLHACRELACHGVTGGHLQLFVHGQNRPAEPESKASSRSSAVHRGLLIISWVPAPRSLKKVVAVFRQ